MDIFAPALLLGQVIGRLGNFVNQELYGPPHHRSAATDFPPCLPWGIHDRRRAPRRARRGTRLTFPVETTQFVPLFAYEMVLNLIGMAAAAVRHPPLRPASLRRRRVLMYLMWYGAVRTLLETYRVNNWTILGVPTAMWVGITRASSSPPPGSSFATAVDGARR